jgi:hypothetical protein
MKTALQILFSIFLVCFAQDTEPNSGELLVSATVGAPAILKDIVLPGAELVAKPIADDPVMIVQIVDAIPHGDSYRYTIRFSGFEPGKHDLAKFLERKDETSTSDLPSVPVEIESLLPAGQVTPNELPQGWLPKLGGYKVLMSVAAALWGLILLAFIFGGRGKQKEEQDSGPPAKTLADLLKTRLEAAFDNQVDKQLYAELERMLFSMWRKKLGYESIPVDEAMSKIKADPKAGPLMTQLENWMHRPDGSNAQVDLAKLLEPYRDLSVDELEPAK